MRKHIIIWCSVFALFALASWAAYIIRGYYALGGEIVIIAIPLMVYAEKICIWFYERR